MHSRFRIVSRVGLSLLACATVGWAAPAGAVPLFAEDVDALQPEACPGATCWTNYLRVTDIDADDDLDLVFVNYAGFFNSGQPQELAIYENDGNAGFTYASGSAVNNHSDRLRQVAIGDVDGDGANDIYAPNALGQGAAFFINDGSGVFTDEADVRLPGSTARAGAARFADFDGDGDLDLYLADGYIGNAATDGHIWLNDGLGVFEELAGAIPAGFSGQDIDDVDVFDADRDYDLDIMVNAHAGDNSLYLNDGNGMFSDASDQLPGQPNLYHYGPAVCDVDGDGDLDIWVDNMGPVYSEQLLINDGNATFTDETGARVSGNPMSADDNGVACADVDNDGDLDAVVFSLSNNERVLENDGAGNFTAVADAFPQVSDPTLWGEFGDLDGDGKLDFVTGQGENQPELNRVYLGNANAPVDDRPPVIIVNETLTEAGAGETPVVRFAVSDNAVTDEGPRLDRAFARVVVQDGESEVDAFFMGGDLFRVVLPEQSDGTSVSVSLCAVDTQGNEGCADTFEYEVGMATGTTGVDTGTATDPDGGTLDASGSGMTLDTGNGPNPGTDDTVTADGTDTATETDGTGEMGGGGCGCRSTAPAPASALAFVLLGLLGRRRGRGSRRGRSPRASRSRS